MLCVHSSSASPRPYCQQTPGPAAKHERKRAADSPAGADKDKDKDGADLADAAVVKKAKTGACVYACVRGYACFDCAVQTFGGVPR